MYNDFSKKLVVRKFLRGRVSRGFHVKATRSNKKDKIRNQATKSRNLNGGIASFIYLQCTKYGGNTLQENDVGRITSELSANNHTKGLPKI